MPIFPEKYSAVKRIFSSTGWSSKARRLKTTAIVIASWVYDYLVQDLKAKGIPLVRRKAVAPIVPELQKNRTNDKKPAPFKVDGTSRSRWENRAFPTTHRKDRNWDHVATAKNHEKRTIWENTSMRGGSPSIRILSVIFPFQDPRQRGSCNAFYFFRNCAIPPTACRRDTGDNGTIDK